MTDASATRALSIWIVNYESAGHLERCIASLGSEPARSIIILDNGSSVEDLDLLERIASRDDRVKVIRSDVNLGFGGGHNRIAQETAGTDDDATIWLLNPDTVIPAGTAAALQQTVLEDRAHIVSPVILSGTPPSERIWFGGGGVDLKRGSVTDSALGRDPSVLRTTPSLIATEFISGAAPMMTRRTWDKLGGFDASLFLYWEDVDLCLRARAAGLDLSIRTDVSIWHAEGGSSKTTPRTREMVYFYTSRNRITVCRTSRLHGWLLILGPGTPPLLILLRQALLRGGKGRSRRALAVLRGSITGARTRFIARSSDNSQYP